MGGRYGCRWFRWGWQCLRLQEAYGFCWDGMFGEGISLANRRENHYEILRYFSPLSDIPLAVM